MFDINECLPTEKDFKDVAEAKAFNDKIRAVGGTDSIDESAAPFYYLLIRRFFACMLLKWTEAAKACESLLLTATNGAYSKADIKVLILTVKANKDKFIDSYDKYKAAQSVPVPKANLGKAKAHTTTPADKVNPRAGEVKVVTHGKTQDFYRIVAYDMRYDGSGARRSIMFGKKDGSLYTIRIGGSEQASKCADDNVLFKTVAEARLFIANINHYNVNTSYELDSLRYSITDEPINASSFDVVTRRWTHVIVDSLKDAVRVNTMCGPAYIFKNSKYCKESLEVRHMNEAIEKHDELNQKLFDGDRLKPEVRQKAQDIVNEFIKILLEDGVKLNVRDVILTGSNASYNYTENSDVDLHIVANTVDLNDPDELYPKLYNCYRRIFESKFDISFYGIPVEVYVEVENNPVVSNGIYSVMFDKWIKEPKTDYVPDIDQKAIDDAAKPWLDRARALIREVDNNLPNEDEKIDAYIKELYELRQKGIHNTEGSEFSTENLVFKEVRNAGLLDELKELKNDIIGRKLSLEEDVGYLDDEQKFFDYGTPESKGAEDAVDTHKASTFMTQDLLDGGTEGRCAGLTSEIAQITPNQYFRLCGKVFGEDPERMKEYVGADKGSIGHLMDVINIYHKAFPMPYVSFASGWRRGQEGRHRMYVLGELYGWDTDFPVQIIQDEYNRKTVKELLNESIEEGLCLPEKARRDYAIELSRLTHNQAIVQQNGLFQIYNVKEDDCQRILPMLRRQG